MFLIIGLGNPGKKYESTRHNFGHLMIERLAKKFTTDQEKFKANSSFPAEILRIRNNRPSVILAKSLSFMNNSGETVKKIQKFYSAKSEDLIIISDDANLEIGASRLRFGGNDGGHNGLKSIIDLIGEKFWRLRIGIGKSDKPLEKYVLEQFSKDEREYLPAIIDKVSDEMIRLLSAQKLINLTIRI